MTEHGYPPVWVTGLTFEDLEPVIIRLQKDYLKAAALSGSIQKTRLYVSYLDNTGKILQAMKETRLIAQQKAGLLIQNYPRIWGLVWDLPDAIYNRMKSKVPFYSPAEQVPDERTGNNE